MATARQVQPARLEAIWRRFVDGIGDRVLLGRFPEWYGRQEVFRPFSPQVAIPGFVGQRLCWTSRLGYFEANICKSDRATLPPVNRVASVLVPKGRGVGTDLADVLLEAVDLTVVELALAAGYRNDPRLPSSAVGAIIGGLMSRWDADDDGVPRFWIGVQLLVVTPMAPKKLLMPGEEPVMPPAGTWGIEKLG